MPTTSSFSADELSSGRAAQYVRMSTDHQKYSTENQAAAIAAFAVQHNLTIVRTYSDEARSGVRLDRRPALKDLISDVVLGRADFGCILVYDVSRWGRFQDADEAAHYEFICKEAGVKVEYCAEEFRNDGSLASSVAKHLKRSMAGEYSRDLSTKVFAGHCRLVGLGFRQGGPPGFGLRRQLIDEHRKHRRLLKHGERKYLQTDRVVLQPGPERELKVVRQIFHQFVVEGKTDSRIARELNERSVPNQNGRRWTSWGIRSLLSNENYIGNNVYNRTTTRLGQKLRGNARELWVRANGVFPAIVEPDLFWQAQEVRRRRRICLSNREMLARLNSLLKAKGHLTRNIIDDAEDLPCHSVYMNRFGSLRGAYKLIGYTPRGSYNHIDARPSLALLIRRLAADITSEVESTGGHAQFDTVHDVLTINDKLVISILIARCQHGAGAWLRWRINRRVDLGDYILAPRMAETGRSVLDYFLIPASYFPTARMEFSERNPLRLNACRFETLDALLRAIWRSMRGKPPVIPSALEREAPRPINSLVAKPTDVSPTKPPLPRR